MRTGLTVQPDLSSDARNKQDDHQSSFRNSSESVSFISCKEEQSNQAEMFDIETSKHLIESSLEEETASFHRGRLIMDPDEEVLVAEPPECEGDKCETAH